MRESDTGLWLHNKLGATDELWAPPSIASLLTAAVIDNIRLCFHGLSSAVKLKLLLGTLHLPRRTVDEVRRAAVRTRDPGARGPLARSRLSPPLAPLVPPAARAAPPPRPSPRWRGSAAGLRPSASGVSARLGHLALRGLATRSRFSLRSPQWVCPFFFFFFSPP